MNERVYICLCEQGKDLATVTRALPCEKGGEDEKPRRKTAVLVQGERSSVRRCIVPIVSINGVVAGRRGKR